MLDADTVLRRVRRPGCRHRATSSRPRGTREVLDVQRPVEGLIVHRVRLESGSLTPGRGGHGRDRRARAATRRGATTRRRICCTPRLREVIGTHVTQAGSLVAPDRLRFDFTHFAALSDHAVADIESAGQSQGPRGPSRRRRRKSISRKRSRVAPWRCSARNTETEFEWCAWESFPWNCAVGRTRRVPERSDWSSWFKNAGSPPGLEGSRPSRGEGSLAAFRHDYGIVRSLEEQLSVPRDLVLEEVEKRLERARGASARTGAATPACGP